MIERPDRTQGKRSFGSCRIAPKVGKTGFFCRFEVYRTAIFPIFRERGLSAEGKLSSLRKGCSPFSPLSCVVAMKYETPLFFNGRKGAFPVCVMSKAAEGKRKIGHLILIFFFEKSQRENFCQPFAQRSKQRSADFDR